MDRNLHAAFWSDPLSTEESRYSISVSENRGQVVVTQTTTVKTVSVGHSSTFSCKTSSAENSDIYGQGMACYQHEPREAPKYLVYLAKTIQSWTPSRFSGSGFGSDFTLTINGVQAEDTGDYKCQSLHYPNSVWVFTQ